VSLVDHGAGKSYLGFILYDLFFKGRRRVRARTSTASRRAKSWCRSRPSWRRAWAFEGMSFLNLSVAESTESSKLPAHDRHRHRAARL
jgi:hypothetical protein